jgi:hypothetical protein
LLSPRVRKREREQSLFVFKVSFEVQLVHIILFSLLDLEVQLLTYFLKP